MSRLAVSVSRALIPFSLFVLSGCGFSAYAGTGTGMPSQSVAYSSSYSSSDSRNNTQNTTVVQPAQPVASRPEPSRVYMPAAPRPVDTRAPVRVAPRVAVTSPYDTRANVALPAPRTSPQPGRVAAEPVPSTRAPVPVSPVAPTGPRMQGGGTPQHRFDRDARPTTTTKPPTQSARMTARPVVAARFVAATPARRVPELRSPPRTLRIAQR